MHALVDCIRNERHAFKRPGKQACMHSFSQSVYLTFLGRNSSTANPLSRLALSAPQGDTPSPEHPVAVEEEGEGEG